jgi:hypothetical protein
MTERLFQLRCGMKNVSRNNQVILVGSGLKVLGNRILTSIEYCVFHTRAIPEALFGSDEETCRNIGICVLVFAVRALTVRRFEGFKD